MADQVLVEVGAETTKFQFPNGNTWEINNKPKWKHIRNTTGATTLEIDEEILIRLTIKWSYPEPVTVESLPEMDIVDVGTVIQAVRQLVTPLLEALPKKI